MAPKQRMRIASEKYNQNVNSRGNVPKSVVVSSEGHGGIVFILSSLQKPDEEKSPIGPYVLAFFIFVVCGSGELG